MFPDMVGHHVKNARRAAGLNQTQAAAAARLSKAALNRIENGRARPNIQTLERIAATYGCSLAALVDPDHAKPDELFSDDSMVARLRGSRPFCSLASDP